MMTAQLQGETKLEITDVSVLNAAHRNSSEYCSGG